MYKKRVFISFDYDDNLNKLIVEQSQRTDMHFSIVDMSMIEPIIND